MTSPTAVQVRARVVDPKGKVHTYQTYGSNGYEARQALYAAAKVFGMKVEKHSLRYRRDSIAETIKHPEGIS